MLRKRRLLPLLLAATFTLLSFPGAAMAKPAESASDEQQVAAAARRVMAKQHSAEDLAMVKSVPELARQVPDPNGLKMTVTTGGLTSAKRTASGVTAAAAENCAGWIAFDIRQTSMTGGTIYRWRHYITACTDGVNVTRFLSRYAYLVQYDGTVVQKEQNINMRGATPHPHTWSHIQQRLVQCVDIENSENCVTHYPWSKIHLYKDHTWNAEWAGGYWPDDGSVVYWWE